MTESGSSDVAGAPRPPAGARPLLALLALFSGLALLLYILAGVSLRLSLALGLVVVIAGFGWSLHRADALERSRVVRNVACGAIAGVLATMTYDLSKGALSLLDPSPYNPFHVIRVFGQILAGGEASETVIVVTGAAFHLLNGTMFGVAYAFLFARDGNVPLRRAILTGVGWGVFLELFQLTLYPGWLDIRFYAEFATISALGHIVYGATLGFLIRTLLRASRAAPAAQLT